MGLNKAQLLQDFINSDYDKVKAVYDNLDSIIAVANALPLGVTQAQINALGIDAITLETLTSQQIIDAAVAAAGGGGAAFSGFSSFFEVIGPSSTTLPVGNVNGLVLIDSTVASAGLLLPHVNDIAAGDTVFITTRGANPISISDFLENPLLSPIPGEGAIFTVVNSTLAGGKIWRELSVA